MRSQILLKPPYHYRAKTAYLLGLLGVLLAAGMCAVKIRDGGTGVLLTDCWIWYLIAYCGLFFLTYPSLTVDAEHIIIRNPLVTSKLSYSAIVGLDTQYQLTLTTKRRRYKALGAPSPGVFGSGVVQSIHTDMGGAVFRGESLMRVASGGVAGDSGRMIAGYLKELRDTGEVENMPLVEKRAVNYLGCGILVILLVCAIVV